MQIAPQVTTMFETLTLSFSHTQPHGGSLCCGLAAITPTKDSLVPVYELICRLESQGVISKTHSPFNSPIWPEQKPDGGWRLTVDCRGLNEVTPLLSAAVPDMLELQ
ncbi:hypothetical protein QYF61_018403 [Mycteria americana]|uniref:Uncharacterized protein n=1 Tax=Mycteria americana TaxID=33587 RepID=A0AAN7RJY6_MYCAM|nr:hypothetical protein QYF61_018403 [Mycteria americana]